MKTKSFSVLYGPRLRAIDADMPERYENPITPESTIRFALRQCVDNCVNEGEYKEAVAHYDALLADNERLREALRDCEAQMTRIEFGHDTGPCFGQAIDAARAALSATERKGTERKGTE